MHYPCFNNGGVGRVAWGPRNDIYVLILIGSFK